MAKPYPIKFEFRSKGVKFQEFHPGSRGGVLSRGKDMVRFTFLEVPLGFWIGNGLQGSIPQEKRREGESRGWAGV